MAIDGSRPAQQIPLEHVLQLLGRGAEGLADRFPICQNVMVEPGPTLARSMIAANLVDRVWVFQSASAIDDDSAPSAATVPGNFIKTGEMHVGADTLAEYSNPDSPVFSASVPSADFAIAQANS